MLAFSNLAGNVPAAWRQAGFSPTLGRAQNFQIRTNFRASYCPACAKPLVSSSLFCQMYFTKLPSDSNETSNMFGKYSLIVSMCDITIVRYKIS